MAPGGDGPAPDSPPGWAVDEAEDEPGASEESTQITRRATEIATEREAQRHDEYDDPDQGGES